MSVAILHYTDALAPPFRAIKAAWLRAMFVLESHDEEVLADPRGHIVDQGGVATSSHLEMPGDAMFQFASAGTIQIRLNRMIASARPNAST